MGGLGLCWHGRAVKQSREHRPLCTIELIAEGHAERCPGEQCAFWEHACVLLDNGRIRCWARNGEGQLGLGATDVIGDNEAQDGTVALRRHGEGDQGTVGLDELAERLSAESVSAA